MSYQQAQLRLNDGGQEILVSQPTFAESIILYEVILSSINYSRQLKESAKSKYRTNAVDS